MRQFRSDVMHWKEYDFTVINDKVNKCYKQIIHFINNKNNFGLSSISNKKFIKNHINNLIN